MTTNNKKVGDLDLDRIQESDTYVSVNFYEKSWFLLYLSLSFSVEFIFLTLFQIWQIYYLYSVYIEPLFSLVICIA